jgi:hypothetical protein
LELAKAELEVMRNKYDEEFHNLGRDLKTSALALDKRAKDLDWALFDMNDGYLRDILEDTYKVRGFLRHDFPKEGRRLTKEEQKEFGEELLQKFLKLVEDTVRMRNHFYALEADFKFKIERRQKQVNEAYKEMTRKHVVDESILIARLKAKATPATLALYRILPPKYRTSISYLQDLVAKIQHYISIPKKYQIEEYEDMVEFCGEKVSQMLLTSPKKVLTNLLFLLQSASIEAAKLQALIH